MKFNLSDNDVLLVHPNGTETEKTIFSDDLDEEESGFSEEDREMIRLEKFIRRCPVPSDNSNKQG
ncbi:hypothetical protein J5289_28405 (plasmid) [Rhizobium sp. B230/85]|uniref:hypothetical protein n=1 Tax=unclassified Rhizobium TaxID=2613769 RepID=UPI001AD9B81F|nr:MULTISPECIES: hypothetical protein [unclassified Rhizobium]MBO9136618.1 hypothetical protein [Rhizobium sp. B209b/85]QXZ99748.1 hypothetical protein J5289_28405 [Rhizobium sp. B230/85]